MNVRSITVCLCIALCGAFCGCVSVESLDAIARNHPFNPQIELSKNSHTISSLPREKLIGKWQGSWVDAEAVWCSDGSYKFFTPTVFTSTYEFKADGTVTWCTTINGKVGNPGNTTWTYYNGELTLNNLKRPYYEVFWFGDDEMVIADRSAETANAFYLKHFKSTHGGEYSHRANYVRDNCLNVRLVHHNVSPSKGVRREHVITPHRYVRIQEESSPESPSDTRQEHNLLYRIISCERESGNNIAYKFALELVGVDKSLKAFRAVQREFREAIKEDYAESYAVSDRNSLYVEFPEYRQTGDKIEGSAVVLTISLCFLKYDPHTRTGVLAVRIGANQFEEARKYIRKNIETLARDKNIALVTGEIPPAAKFYIGREEIKDGNILEIEFKTE